MIDMVHDATNVMAKGEDEDRISNLPDDIIHRILSFLDIKYAIQTSQLSRKWKHVWTEMPYLSFNSRMFRNVHLFAKFTDHVLSHRNDETDVSEIELTFTGLTTTTYVKNLVNYAYLHNVRKLTMICNGWKSHHVLHYLFSSHTLKHLTLQNQSRGRHMYFLPTFAWDFPALETLTLGNMCLGYCGDKSINLFSKCVNLKDLTLHRVTMHFVDIFNICCLQLANLTITDVISFPKVFIVVAPKLKNLTASVRALRDYPQTSFDCLLLTEGFYSLEKVNLFLSPLGSNRIDRIGLPVLLNLFQKLRSANFLILNSEIIEFPSIAASQKRPLEQLYEVAKSKVAKLEEKIQMQDEYEALKSLFLTRIDASEWEKIETELGSIRHFERTRSTNIHTQSNAPADVSFLP
ncbi:F-box domain, cyclin-like protein [Tanacetum coccineum]